ncbi:MAG: hypothetical protein ISR58_08965 [Anaerolineales bacterium]|nr:hypothetical protein [Chloroflexota bacterium]MBL6981308.1 hypothetical protein [Anaerolineales bacterium]
MKKLALLVILIILARNAQSTRAQSGFDYTAEPINGTHSLWSGFTPELFQIGLSFGGYEDVSDYFSSSECAGFTTSEPTFNLDWNGNSDGISFFFIGPWDTSMVLQSPDGDWFCNDDYSQNSPHPFIHLDYPSTGTYNIWIGAPSANIYENGSLMITEGNYSPENYSSVGGSQQSAADIDGDGISDDTELWIAESFMPVYEFDYEEHNILKVGSISIRENRDVMFLWQVSPVKCGVKATSGAIRFYLETLDSNASLPSWIENSESMLLTVVATYPYDYVPFDLTTEQDIFTHYGDTERVRLCITKEESNYSLLFAQINRHHETAYYVSSDLTIIDNSHPYLFVSEGKHATFASDAECEGSVSALHIFHVENPFDKEEWKEGFSGAGWDEDCDGGPVIRPSVVASLNVGEYEPNTGVYTNHLGNSQLSSLFPGEVVWNPDTRGRGSVFCGGYDIELDDYSEKYEVITGYNSPWCSGTLDSKWWPPRSER